MESAHTKKGKIDMRERPILFSAPMIRAILDGRKTQTRRIVKPAPSSDTTEILHSEGREWREWFPHNGNMLPKMWIIRCPHGQPGDRLWVKETWRTSYAHDSVKPLDIPEGDPIRYEADGEETGPPLWGWGRIRQSIFMRQWMSRITLEITGIRVERLQDITPDDCRAEGMPHENNDIGVRYGYGQLWNQINGPGSWDANPWVWALTFKLLIHI